MYSGIYATMGSCRLDKPTLAWLLLLWSLIIKTYVYLKRRWMCSSMSLVRLAFIVVPISKRKKNICNRLYRPRAAEILIGRFRFVPDAMES